ncbi:MAG: GNAT family N-acetyltransferase [Pseudomonadota bacterium]
MLSLTVAEPSDHDQIHALFLDGFRDYARDIGREPGPNPWLHDAIAAGDIHWLIDGGGAEVGATWLVSKEGGLALEMLVIDPKAQNAGHGTAALARIEAEALKRGARHITLYTASRRTHLVAFYSKHGFRVWKVGPHPQGRDDYLRVYMTKPLN